MSELPTKQLGQPVLLDPVYIPKPWGQEIWHTGIEARGESGVIYNDQRVPLSQYLQIDTGALTNHQPVLLLKELDPQPTAVLGDLYFEVHEIKQEVYVVTQIDQLAWPNQIGGIRFGMDQTKREQYDNDDDFRADYLAHIQNYEKIRRTIDDSHHKDENTLKLEQSLTDNESLALQESEARAAMESFTHMRPLSVGEVVQVPTWTPHALQHGVRVVEFQTPTYERFIVSFAQKVLTQSHWDSVHAVQRMHIDSPATEKFTHIADGIERIAEFSDFNVWRVDLGMANNINLPVNIPYAVCMALADDIAVGPIVLKAEQACFIPHIGIKAHKISAISGHMLIAAPGL